MTRAHAAFYKGYADTSAGQMHYRRAGEGPALVLVHWTPFSSRMYGPVIPHLTAAGRSVVAFDLPGYGRSDPRPDPWSMEDYGRILAEGLTALDIHETAVVGGHAGAAAALELALAAPEKVSHLILDGLPFLTPDLKAVLQQMQAAPRPSVHGDKDVKTLAFEAAAGVYAEYLPGFAVTDETIDQVWAAMVDYLETDFVSSASVLAAYDAEGRLARLDRPLTILGGATDSLRTAFDAALALQPGASSYLIQGRHPLHIPDEAYVYADILLASLAGTLAEYKDPR